MRNKIKKFTESIDANKFQEVLDEIKTLIESSVDNSGGDFKSFVESFIKDPSNFKIEGLINESDIYDFYLKYRNQIDECLNDIKFYDNPPSEIGALGLYEYTIKGTMTSVEEFVKQL